LTENLRLLKTKVRGAVAQLRYLPRALELVWESARYKTLVWIGLLFVQGLLPVATVYLTRSLVNDLVASVAAGGVWESVRPILMVAALLAAILLLSESLRIATRWIRAAQSELIQDHISSLIHEKSVAADLAFYETPDFYDRLHRARADASYRPIALVESLGSMLQNGLTLLAMGAVLIPFGHWLPPALLLSALPVFFVVLRHTLRQHEWRARATEDERRTWYYDWLLTSGESAAELRLFALGDHFRSAYQAVRARLRNERLELAKDQGLAELGAVGLGLAITGVAMAWMVWQVLKGRTTLGDLALFYQAFNQGQRLMHSLLENAGQLYANSLFLGDLFEFLALEPRVVDPPHFVPAPFPLSEGIRFHQVGFRYPGSDRMALDDFNLAIPAGQFVAVVGPNGAGKSTLIKLLCRLYDPERGRIEIDGIDLRDLPAQDLRRLITVMFQEPVCYNATVMENIRLGDRRAPGSMAGIAAAARAAAADEIVARLPGGYENPLGRWFDGGAELSRGEWQRIALARAFFRNSPVILLDEPTGAMDSWAESDWLERFHSVARGRTAVVITHRLTTAMRADRIDVMADGRIVESGSHGELLARGGKYAESWALQVDAWASQA